MTFDRSPLYLLNIAWLCVALSGCGEDRSTWYSDIHDLSSVPLSEDLKPSIAAGVAALDVPDPDTESVRHYSWSQSVRAKILPLETRAEASSEIYNRWNQNPGDLICLRLAGQYFTHLERDEEYEKLLHHPALMDTNTAVGAYAESRRTEMPGGRTYWYKKSERLQDDLSPLYRGILTTTYTILDRRSGNFQDAIYRLIAELPEARQAGGHMMESVYWGYISRRLATADRLDDSLQAATLAVAHAEITNVPFRIFMAKIDLATISAQRGEYNTAMAKLEHLADLAEQKNIRWAVLVALDNAAKFASETGDYQRALAYDRHILRYVRQMDDKVNIPRSLGSIAHDHNMTGNLDSTRVYLQQAKDYVDASGVKVNRAKMAELMAGYYCQVGNYAAAESMLVNAVDAYDPEYSRVGQAALLLQLIPNALEMGRPDLAYEWLARVAEVKDSLAPRSRYVNYLADYELLSARLLLDQGEYLLAYEALSRARDAIERSGGEGKLWELEAQTGRLALHRGDATEAERAFRACFDMALGGQDLSLMAQSRFQLGQLYLDQGQFAQAQELFILLNSESTFGNAYRTGLTSILLRGLTYLKDGQYEVAWRFFQDGLDRLNEDSPADIKQRFHLFKGLSLTGMEQYSLAEQEFEKVETSFRADPLQNRFEKLAVYATNIKREVREAKVSNATAAHQDDLPSIAQITLEFAYPGLAKRIANSRHEGPTLAFFLGEKKSWSWLANYGKITLRELPSREELQNILAPVLIDLHQPSRQSDDELLALLATTLLDDLAYSWPIGTPLTLVLDGVLKMVPWAALPLPGSQQIVLERGPVREISATGSSAHQQESERNILVRPQDLKLIAIGCDRPAGFDLAPLREAQKEAQLIHSAWGANGGPLLLGEDANWANAQAQGIASAGVIHIASHADVRHGSAARSTLRLADQSASTAGPATPVTMTAIAKLELQAEVVYLSSCRAGAPTMIGKSSDGDFINTFLGSGARTVIASTQWMDDDAARALAVHFYEYWRMSSNQAEALQAARLKVREAWSHPSYWAFMRLVAAD